ncbi:symmetrical bis(5'-nucleosyl)-tetraphosphatase [Chitinimonas sp.]|uniref:symmetrical bis(5'-nucleosyl)-tetraphosphatase n=1 Tax=Chitinimonas sp. TaxID=1934313 RepID=UPI0035B43052
MARYAIGDVQGCFREFIGLLERIDFRVERDRLVLLGDLVNRGPGSLEVLRWVHAHRDAVDCVLGNHDLHLLARHAGHGTAKGGDTLDEVLAAPDADELLTWLRRQPLVRRDGADVFVHAGLWPTWSSDDALALSGEVSAVLASADYAEFLMQMYGNKPTRWSDTLAGVERLRLVVNICTRMRFLTDDGALEYKSKGKGGSGLRAWFDVAHARRERVLFGHWSALGLVQRPDVIALDTGCVWGGALTAIRLDDGAVFQQPSQQPRLQEAD